MHSEWGTISQATAEALNAARANGGRIVAVGTTSLRLLESATAEDGTIEPFAGETAIFITPGYRFRAVDILLTNFHLPRSTLFMLVSAFSGLDTMKHAYAHAIKSGYRFYSYGDACLLFRARDWGSTRSSLAKFGKSAPAQAITRCGSNSAIWIAFKRGSLQQLVGRHEYRDRMARGIAEIPADAADQNVVLA